MAADVDPQRAVAGELLAAVRTDLLLLARVSLEERRRGEHMEEVKGKTFVPTSFPHYRVSRDTAGHHIYQRLIGELAETKQFIRCN